MANVKMRSNAHKSVKKDHIEAKTVNNTNESITVMKNNIILDTSDDIVNFLQRNGNKVKDQEIKSKLNGNDKLKSKVFPLYQSSLMSKSGRIKRKDPEKLKLFDNILKSELLISDTDKNAKSSKKKTVNNNNDAEISDHNQSTDKSSGNDPIVSPLKKHKQDKSKRKDPKKAVEKLPEPDPIPVEPVPSFFECDHCGKTFKAKRYIIKHIYGHLNLKPHQCPHCPKKFHYRVNMQVHVMRLHADKDDDSLSHYECRVCEKAFLMRESLNEHLSTHHSKKASFYKCIFCENKFSTSSQLTDHEKKHLVEGRYQCPMCTNNYGIRLHMEAHLKSHMKIKDFICQYCGKEFLRLNSLQRHVQVCHAGHRVQCPICKKKLKGHLTEHLRTHDKKRPHECPDCGQCFTQSTQLTVHRRSHTGSRPYPCRICDRSFSHSTALMLHIRRHTGEKPFPCAMCPLMFSQLPHMKAHMRKIHGKENAYKCKKCAQFFKLKVDLEGHMKTCVANDKVSSKKSKSDEVEVESVMTLSRMRYLLAVLLTIIASKEKLKCLGFNKRLIDDLLVESLEAMNLEPCSNDSLSPLLKLKSNIEILLDGTVPKHQMENMKKKKRTTEEILELLTDENKSE